MIRRRLLCLLVMTGLCATGCKKPEAKHEAPAASTSVSAAKPEEPKGTTFSYKMPTVGSKRDDTSAMSMSLTVDPTGTGKAQKSEMAMAESVHKTEEVMAVNGDAVTKVKVKYESYDTKATEAGKEKKKSSPLAGKTYLVEAKDGKIEVRDEKGKFVPAVEGNDVEKQYHTLGKPDPMGAAMPKTPLKPGDRADSIAKAIQEQMKAGSDGMNVSDITVTLREIKGDVGVFDVALKLSKEEGPMSMSMDMKGETDIVAATGEPMLLDIKGPITIGAKPDAKSKMKMDGSGSMSMKMERKKL